MTATSGSTVLLKVLSRWSSASTSYEETMCKIISIIKAYYAFAIFSNYLRHQRFGILHVHVLVCYRALVGEMDEALDARLDLSSLRAEPLQQVIHWSPHTMILYHVHKLSWCPLCFLDQWNEGLVIITNYLFELIFSIIWLLREFIQALTSR